MKKIAFLLTIILVLLSAVAFANSSNSSIVGNNANGINFSKEYQSAGPKEADKAIQERATPILNAYIWFGYAIALGMVVFIGIKYMLGAADARANMKSAIVGWLIGAFVVFMATTIVSLVLNVASPNGQTADGLANQIVDSGWSLTN